MKKSKLLIFAVAVISIVIMVTAAAFSVSAIPSDASVFSPSKAIFDVEGFGSHDVGVSYTGHYAYYPPFEVDGHGNLNFEKGLEGWFVGTPAHGKLKVDSNGNKCVTMVTEKSYESIRTIMFPMSKLKAGDKATVMYKWRGDSYAMQVTLREIYSLKRDGNGPISFKEARIGAHEGYGATHLWAADEENPEDWNITFTINKDPVIPLDTESQLDKLYYVIVAEAMNNPNLTNGMDVDDFQIVIHNDEQRKVYDLDGKVLYDLNNLPKREEPHYDFTGLSPNDENAKIKVNLDKLLSNGANSVTEKDPSDKDSDNSGVIEEEKGGALVWVIIAIGVVLLLAAAAVVFIIIKKKKAGAVQSEEVTTEQE